MVSAEDWLRRLTSSGERLGLVVPHASPQGPENAHGGVAHRTLFMLHVVHLLGTRAIGIHGGRPEGVKKGLTTVRNKKKGDCAIHVHLTKWAG